MVRETATARGSAGRGPLAGEGPVFKSVVCCFRRDSATGTLGAHFCGIHRSASIEEDSVLLAGIYDDLFTAGVPLTEKAIRTVAVYLGVLLLLRLAGKRDLAQLNTFDFVVLLLLSNVVQN